VVTVLSALEQHFGSAQALKSCEQELRKRLHDRGILFGEGLLPTYAHAFIAPRAQIDRWATQAQTLIEAVEKTAKLLAHNEDFYRSMGLSDNALELVRIDPGYERICVLCRPDGIPVGEGIKFVEVNSDSPAMMMFIDVVAQCLLELEAFAWLRDHRPRSAADALLDALLECYREYGGDRGPNIAIVDWAGQKTRFEHERLAERFESLGHPTVVCDPRALRRVDGELRFENRRIDLVYRRALASEVIKRAEDIAPLLDAYRDGTICMVNPLRSYMAGAKSVLSYLADNGGSEVIPRTILLDNPDKRELVRATPSKWVLKKSESHGGEDVVLPEPENEAMWHAALAASANGAWIAQEYLQVPKLALSVVDGESIGRVERHYNWNPFMFAGRYAGGLVRVSSTPLINITLGGGLLPTFSK
jgi:hypothetical protein